MADRAALDEPRTRLTRERVLRAAMSLADSDGIDSLTMRRLAEELGVQAMSLYHYVRNKEELVAGILDLVVSEIEPPPAGGDWRQAVRRSAISFHDALRRHRWANGLMSSPTRVFPGQLRSHEALLKRLRDAGFSPDLTHHAYHALDSHIVGSSLWEAGIAAAIPKGRLPEVAQQFLERLPVEEFPYFHEHVQQHLARSPRGEKSVFEFGLDLILDGLERIRLAESRGRRRPRRRLRPAARAVRGR